VLEELRTRGALPEADIERIRTPAGLDIGARTAEEIALSILAEIVSTRSARPALPVPVPDETAAVHSCCEHAPDADAHSA
jgi:xanthine dehydrogenase accessory factor